MFGTIIGPITCGLVVDYYGIYRNAFLSIGLISYIGGFLFYFARKPNFDAKKDKILNLT